MRIKVSGPVTPGQVSFFLGIIPVLVGWAYSEFLEHRRNSTSRKTGRDSNINLLELGKNAVNEEDRAALLEDGAQSKPSKVQHPSITSQLFRFLLMDDSFLLENRLILRAISEYGVILAYFYVCDRTDFFGESTKSYNRDLFLFLYFLLIIVSAIISFKTHHDKSPFSGKSILYLNRAPD